MRYNHQLQILEEVAAERTRQTEKWGVEQDDKNNPLDWHEIIADYNGWARRMLCMGSITKGRRRLIQLAAIAVAEVEALDRRFPDLAMDDHGDHPDRP